MEKELTAEKAKLYLEDSYTHQESSKPTANKRAFALKKDQFQDFIKNSDNKNPQNPQITPDSNKDAALQLSRQPTDEVFNLIQSSPEKMDIRLPQLPTLIVNEPVLRSLDQTTDKEGANSLDRSTQKVLNDCDEFDASLSRLLTSMQEVEKSVINCENFSKINKVMSSASLRQLTQIHADHSNDSIIYAIKTKIISFFKKTPNGN